MIKNKNKLIFILILKCGGFPINVTICHSRRNCWYEKAREKERVNKDWKRRRLEGVAMSIELLLHGIIDTFLWCQEEKKD